MGIRFDRNGFSLLEVLVAVLVIGMVITGFQQILRGLLETGSHVRTGARVVGQGRFAMERMAAMIRETGGIGHPAPGASDSQLKVAERISDMYDNGSHSYAPAGDGYADADTNRDGRVNNGSGNDGYDWVTFRLDTSDAGNWKLVEVLPDYRTGDEDDYLSPRILCEYVTGFVCTFTAPNLVELVLTLEQESRALHLKTRVIAERIGT